MKEIEIPFLRSGKNKLGVIDETQRLDVLQSYDPLNVHKAPLVNGPHEKEDLEPLGWIEYVSEKEIDGRKWDVAHVKPVSDEGAVEIARLMETVKFNSPEADKLSHDIQSSMYPKKTTAGWPGKATNKWHLRRINFTPLPAQFGMPQAALSDAKGEFIVIKLSEIESIDAKGGESMAEETKSTTETKVETKEEVVKPAVEEPKKATPAKVEAKEEEKPKEDPQLLALSTQLIAEKQARESLEKRLKDLENTSRKKDISNELLELQREGKVTPGMLQMGLAEIAFELDRSDVVVTSISLSEDGKKTELKQSAYDTLKNVLRSAPVGLSGGKLQILNAAPVLGKSIEEVVAKHQEALKKSHPEYDEKKNYIEAVMLAEKDPDYIVASAGGK